MLLFLSQSSDLNQREGLEISSVFLGFIYSYRLHVHTTKQREQLLSFWPNFIKLLSTHSPNNQILPRCCFAKTHHSFMGFLSCPDWRNDAFEDGLWLFLPSWRLRGVVRADEGAVCWLCLGGLDLTLVIL